MTYLRLTVGADTYTSSGNVVQMRLPLSNTLVTAEVIATPRAVEIDANEIVDAIVAHIKESSNSFAEAGNWITAVTNAATGAIREEDKP